MSSNRLCLTFFSWFMAMFSLHSVHTKEMIDCFFLSVIHLNTLNGCERSLGTGFLRNNFLIELLRKSASVRHGTKLSNQG